jgi:hypothetical protein
VRKAAKEQAMSTAKTQSAMSENLTPAPDADIEGYLRHERRHLHQFFNKLAEANIFTLRDLEQYSAADLFRVAPTSTANQQRVMNYVRRGLITLRPTA